MKRLTRRCALQCKWAYSIKAQSWLWLKSNFAKLWRWFVRDSPDDSPENLQRKRLTGSGKRSLWRPTISEQPLSSGSLEERGGCFHLIFLEPSKLISKTFSCRHFARKTKVNQNLASKLTNNDERWCALSRCSSSEFSINLSYLLTEFSHLWLFISLTSLEDEA